LPEQDQRDNAADQEPKVATVPIAHRIAAVLVPLHAVVWPGLLVVRLGLVLAVLGPVTPRRLASVAVHGNTSRAPQARCNCRPERKCGS